MDHIMENMEQEIIIILIHIDIIVIYIIYYVA